MGYFPTKLKNALIVLIPKAGKDSRKTENYRPITFFDKILNDRFTIYMEINNHLNYNQYGFRKGRGTQQAFAYIYESIAFSQRNGQRHL